MTDVDCAVLLKTEQQITRLLETQKEELLDRLSAVYRERAEVVAALAGLARVAGWHVWVGDDDALMDDWPVLYIETPVGQCSWHYNSRDAELIERFRDAARGQWDGSQGSTKSERLQAISGMVPR